MDRCATQILRIIELWQLHQKQHTAVPTCFLTIVALARVRGIVQTRLAAGDCDITMGFVRIFTHFVQSNVVLHCTPTVRDVASFLEHTLCPELLQCTSLTCSERASVLLLLCVMLAHGYAVHASVQQDCPQGLCFARGADTSQFAPK